VGGAGLFEAILASSLAGLATGLGALPLILMRRVPPWVRDGLLGFAAGVMIAAASFSLLLPALQVGPFWLVLVGLSVGAVILGMLEWIIPAIHRASALDKQNDDGRLFRRGLIIAIAIALHNFPEGLAVGLGYAAGGGLPLALAIGAHNAPEGLVVAASFREQGMPWWRILIYTLLTGMVEPVAAWGGFLLGDAGRAFLPFGFALAAGAMIYVVSDELIPESHGAGNERLATFAVMLGVILMLSLQFLYG
jgi:ZIP family zinc transporter